MIFHEFNCDLIFRSFHLILQKFIEFLVAFQIMEKLVYYQFLLVNIFSKINIIYSLFLTAYIC